MDDFINRKYIERTYTILKERYEDLILLSNNLDSEYFKGKVAGYKFAIDLLKIDLGIENE